MNINSISTLQDTIVYNFSQYKYAIENSKHISFETNLKKNGIIKQNIPSYKNKKEKIIYKINLILNKLSLNNQLTIIQELLLNRADMNIMIYEEIQKNIFMRILNDTAFIHVYINFLLVVGYVFNKLFNYNLHFFITCIEKKFNHVYNIEKLILNLTDVDNIKFNFLINVQNNEDIRHSILKLIFMLYQTNLFNKDIVTYCTDVIFNSKYKIDIYNWIKLVGLNNNLKKMIINIINTDNLQLREKTLLENLLI